MTEGSQDLHRVAGSPFAQPPSAFPVGEDGKEQRNAVILHLVHAQGPGQGEVPASNHDELPRTRPGGDLGTFQPHQTDIADALIHSLTRLREKADVACYRRLDLIQCLLMAGRPSHPVAG
jgi:hypothetical protein